MKYLVFFKAFQCSVDKPGCFSTSLLCCPETPLSCLGHSPICLQFLVFYHRCVSSCYLLSLCGCDPFIAVVVLTGSEEGAERGVRQGGKEGLLEEVSFKPGGRVLLVQFWWIRTQVQLYQQRFYFASFIQKGATPWKSTQIFFDYESAGTTLGCS